jgi:hypothetical protein
MKLNSSAQATLLLLITLAVGVICAKTVQVSVGSYSSLKRQIATDEKKASFDDNFKLNDGSTVTLQCRVYPSESTVKSVTGRSADCSVYVESDYVLSFSHWNEETPGLYASYIKLTPAPRIFDRRYGDKIKLNLGSHERQARPLLLGALVATIPLCFNIDFYTEEDSLKALFVSSLQRGARFTQTRIDEFGIDRIARLLVAKMNDMTGIFELRRHKSLLLFGGTFQAVVLSIFFTSLFLTLLVFSKTAVARVFPLVDSSDIGSLAANLGGALTYFGLVGTLLGIFLAVGELSAIDFVDEMKKVFDQTRSFGAMSLALGSSVLGLGGALLIWLLQAIGNFISGKRLFEF